MERNFSQTVVDWVKANPVKSVFGLIALFVLVGVLF